MKKVFHFGKHAVYSNRKINEVCLEMRLEMKNGRPCFSVCCDVWNIHHTDVVMCGQCLDTVAETCPELKRDKLYMIIMGLWERNHLNDMHAGTECQEKALDEHFDNGRRWSYDEACEYLKSIGLHVDNGYEYGTGWLYREISDGDMAIINELFGEVEYGKRTA